MSEEQGIILVADDEESVRSLLRRVLTKMGFAVIVATNGQEVLALVKEQQFDLLIMDIRMPVLDGMEAFKILRLEYPLLPIIMMTAFGTIETTLETMRLGAFDYITKPFDVPEIKQIVEKAMTVRQKSCEQKTEKASSLQAPVSAFIGSGSAMQEVFKTIGRVSASDSSVLIEGESGTGKELVARTIHQYSSRKNMPFVTVNCGAVPEGVLESEFFGHEKGAFTGAYTRKVGKFEFANGGTIFLDEIGEMSPQLQVKLLRVLQEREFERVGGNEQVKVDVRIVAATNRGLKKSVAAKAFRADLYYRLNVVSINMPPLRERKEDISLLAAHFRDKYCARFGKEPKQIAEATMGLLEGYSWPGNVRELENTIEHAIVMGSGGVILPEDLPEDLLEAPEGNAASEHNLGTLREIVKTVEKQAIASALRKTGGNKLQASKLLDISRRALQYKIEEYGLDDAEGEGNHE